MKQLLLMRIVLFGPPGAGKGTQADLLAERRNLTHISTGMLLRTAMKNDTPLGREAKSYVNSGRLVPDTVVRSLAEEAISGCDYKDFILDGYPRTVQQAEWLTEYLTTHQVPLQAIISVNISEDAVIARLSKRRVHRTSGENYHLDFRPPPQGMDPDMLVQRPDDRPEAVRKRLSVYRRETAPVVSYYETHEAFYEIDGEGDVETVYQRIDNVLEQALVAHSSR